MVKGNTKISHLKQKIKEKIEPSTDIQFEVIIIIKTKEADSRRIHVQDDSTLHECHINKENNEIRVYKGM